MFSKVTLYTKWPIFYKYFCIQRFSMISCRHLNLMLQLIQRPIFLFFAPNGNHTYVKMSLEIPLDCE